MNKTTIEWTDRTWNPVTGCTKVSQGCKNCYAERFYERFKGHGAFKLVHLHPERLDAPKSWETPSMVFVNSMSDLYHEAVPFDFINRVFYTMLIGARHHTYQILTKRPERAIEYFQYIQEADNGMYSLLKQRKNIWIGVSVEDQATADQRTPLLLQMPLPVRFISCEPLLGPLRLYKLLGRNTYANEQVQWIICGGESGPHARPMHPEWARELRDYCAMKGIPFFLKQWGEWRPYELDAPTSWHCSATGASHDVHSLNLYQVSGKHGRFNGCTWMDESKAHAYCMATQSEYCMFLRMGKKKAGHMLDGEEYQQFPNLQ